MPTHTRTHRPQTSARAPERRRPKTLAAVLTALLVAAIGLALSLTALSRHAAAASAPAPATPADSMATVVTVNGQPIPVREFELFLAQDRAATFQHFQQKYDDNDGANFWTTPYGGQTPTQYLEHQAVADATSATVQLQLARTYGLAADIGYPAFLKSLAAENTQRREDVKSGKPIYGPEQYTETTYFLYEQSTLATELTTTLTSRNVIPVTDAALRAYYAAHASDYQTTSTSKSVVAGPQSAPGLESFDQVKSEVEQDYATYAYDAFVARQAAAATVRIDQRELSSIDVS
ncbi:hypothetical protein KDL01_00615 [Actinospica durhamensis]|uniref:Uncharacterized protein n=1 Tax=Actinospica durhamensis TaxID=1508375 RepID=A0A941EJY1_9ACTN|nr:hypothetical protein [Actinospica durhamensis]MBR7831738.1 hypothetical protein [Actinospica durhamensis]